MPVLLGACALLGSLCAGLLAAAAWLWLTRQRTSIPGPQTLPLLGNALLFLKLPVLWDRLGKLHSRYGDIFRLYVGPKLVIVLTQPEDVQNLLVTSKPRERDPYITHVLGTFMGEGLLTAKGNIWKRHRKAIEPLFHAEELEKFMEEFNNSGRLLCERLSERQGTEIEMYTDLLQTTLSSAAGAMFGLNLERIFPSLHRQTKVIHQVAEFAMNLGALTFRPWATINLINWMTAEGRLLRRFNTVAEYMIDRGFELAYKQLDDLKGGERSVLTRLLKGNDSGMVLTEEELRDEAKTLSSAAVDTTAASVGYILTLLGLHPEWQDLAQRELDDYFGTESNHLTPVTTADIGQLKVIEAIVKEAGRLFSTVPCMPYLATEDVPLAGGRYVAPQGSTLLIAYYLMHRHPKLFPEPDKFDPGRFLEGGSGLSRKPYSLIPFGVGSHKCIGARFAALQIKVILSLLLRRFRILPGSTRMELEESVMSITSHPITGFRVTFVPRDNIPSNPV